VRCFNLISNCVGREGEGVKRVKGEWGRIDGMGFLWGVDGWMGWMGGVIW
jgi:hypothetical protein